MFCRRRRSPPRSGARSRWPAHPEASPTAGLGRSGSRRAGRASGPTRPGTPSTGSPNGRAPAWGAVSCLPLMLEGGLRRTIAVTMAPVAPLRAVRRAEHDRTSGAADAELRRRHGFAVTARTRHEHEATTRRETELAEGHAAFRFTGYLAVTADDEAALAAACGRLEQTAAPGSARAAPHVRRAGGGLHLHACRRAGGAHEAAGSRVHDGPARRRLPVRRFASAPHRAGCSSARILRAAPSPTTRSSCTRRAR